MDTHSSSSTWSLKVLLLPPLVIALLFWSWKFSLTSPFWEACDHAVFHLLNPWIQTAPFWQNFWAFNSSSIMDWLHDIGMSLFFFIPICQAPKGKKRRKISELLFSILFLLFVIGVVNGTLFPEFLHFSRKSPTITEPNAFRLSTVVNWISFKDHSYESFPGDHGTLGMAFTCLIFYLAGKKAGLCAIVYAIFFCLPRLVTGAHWFTDIFLGSLPIAIVMTSLFFGTPLSSLCITAIEKGLFKLFSRSKT